MNNLILRLNNMVRQSVIEESFAPLHLSIEMKREPHHASVPSWPHAQLRQNTIFINLGLCFHLSSRASAASWPHAQLMQNTIFIIIITMPILNDFVYLPLSRRYHHTQPVDLGGESVRATSKCAHTARIAIRSSNKLNVHLSLAEQEHTLYNDA